MVGTELNDAIGLLSRLGRSNAVLLLIVGLLFILRILIGSGLVRLVLFLLFVVGFFSEIAFADALTIGNAEHHDDIVRLLLREGVARNVPPVEVPLCLVSQQT